MAGLLVVVGASVAAYLLFFGYAVPEAKDLRPFVKAPPPLPVVFTSRTEPASFEAAAPEAEQFAYPGTVPWAAREGRLRLLDTDGKVYELTWGRELPGGGTLIDVMSPSVTPDGKRVVFAGRRAAPEPGRWRIYEVGVDGRDLRQRTGSPDDSGCVALPPVRFAADGSRMPDADRKRLDYDDVDPIELGDGSLVFASSRLPDLGRDHARRATQIWIWPKAAAAPSPLSANRNNDRWPYATTGDLLIIFSLWSRNREAVTEDQSEIRPVAGPDTFATAATDLWVGARVMPDATQFGYAVKIPQPVWRPRPLFNGRVVFMTADGPGRFRLAQADWGYLRVAPSSLATGGVLPKQVGGQMLFGPDIDAEGRALSAGCPSPGPPLHVLFAAAPVGSPPAAYGLYLVPEAWEGQQVPQLLFDDPGLVDAEPVAVYARPLPATPPVPPTVTNGAPAKLPLFGDRFHTGKSGLLENNLINSEMPDPFPGQKTDIGEGPVIPHPTGIKSVVFYAAHRDRFDDPARPRVPGVWEKLLVAPVSKEGALKAWVPAEPMTPTVLAGLGEDGKIFKWSSKAKDSAGRSATFYAIAGDHYSGTRADGYHFCLGCHTGHTFITADIRERAK